MIQKQALVFVSIFIGFSSTAFAIPSLILHRHDALATTWKPPGGIAGPEHQHRDAHALNGTSQVVQSISGIDYGFIANKAWDDGTLHTLPHDGQFAHGYMENPAKYAFVDLANPAQPPITIPNKNGFAIGGRWETDSLWKSMKTVINSAFGAWESAVNGTGINTNGIAYKTKIDFESTTNNDWDIAIILDYQLDAGDVGITITPGFGLPSVDFDALLGFTTTPGQGGWYLGMDDLVPNNMYEFWSTSEHEIGHLLGLGHYGTDRTKQLMQTGGFTTGNMAQIDIGSLDGVKDLYSVVPEPGTMLLFFIGGASLIVRRLHLYA